MAFKYLISKMRHCESSWLNAEIKILASLLVSWDTIKWSFGIKYSVETIDESLPFFCLFVY